MNSIIIPISIIVGFFIFALILATKTKYRENALNNYEKVTEKLIKKPEKKEEISSSVSENISSDSLMSLVTGTLGVGITVAVGGIVISQLKDAVVDTGMNATSPLTNSTLNVMTGVLPIVGIIVVVGVIGLPILRLFGGED